MKFKFLRFILRKWFRACIHGNDVVLCLEGPYPMCPLCIEKVLREHADSLLFDCSTSEDF